MPRIQTTGIVVRRIPYQESSELMYWLTPTHGIVHTLAKGIHRPRSSFKGCFDLLDSCDIAYTTSREGEGLALLVAAHPLHRWRGLRASVVRLQAAFVAIEVIREFVQLEQESTAIYECFRRLLDLLGEEERVGFVLAWFRMRSLTLLGHRPELSCCLVCGTSSPRSPRVYFVGGGIVCTACRGTRGGLAQFSAATLALLGALSDVDDPRALMSENPPLGESSRREVRRFLRDYTACILDRMLLTDGGARRKR